MTPNTEKLTLPIKLANLRMAGLAAFVACVAGALLISVLTGQGVTLFWQGYVYGLVFLLSLWLGPFAVLMIHHMTGGNWTFIIQRMLEAATRTWMWPVAAIAILIGGQWAGAHHLYDGWAVSGGDHPSVTYDELVKNKAFYLNLPFWSLRAAVFISIWLSYMFAFNRWSKKLDETGDEKYIVKMRWWAPTGVILYCLTMTFAATDWYMSLEPDWYSTIYGPLFWISQGLTTFATFILILSMFADHKPMSKYITVEHYYMIGTFMMAFVIIWAYMSFAQYLLIWAGNLPEEISWYLVRDTNGWNVIAVGLMLFHFFVPLLYLLQRRFKFQIKYLRVMCFWMLFWRLVDVFYIVNPAFHHDVPGVYPIDFLVSVLMAAGMVGLWLFLFLGELTKSTAMPLNDSRLYLAMHHVPNPKEAVEHA